MKINLLMLIGYCLFIIIPLIAWHAFDKYFSQQLVVQVQVLDGQPLSGTMVVNIQRVTKTKFQYITIYQDNWYELSPREQDYPYTLKTRKFEISDPDTDAVVAHGIYLKKGVTNVF